MTIADTTSTPSPEPLTAGELIARADLDSASWAIRGVTVRTPLGLPPGLKIMREGLPTLPSVSLGLYSARAAEISQAASSVAGVIAGVVDQSLQAAI